MTVTFYGSGMVVESYNAMGTVKATLEKSPNRAFATIEDAGAYAAFLASDLAKSVNGTIP